MNFFIMKNKYFYLFIFIFLCGIFLRTFHFSEWLHFELDQARDSFVISDSIENYHNLPLLGPQARGRELQLGPIFYYFQFISAKIFGTSPVAEALPDLFFSILTIPLIYLFSQQFYSKRISFYLFAITSFSYFVIVYSRFAWNPNSMAFWSILSAHALMKASHHFSKKEETIVFIEKNSDKKNLLINYGKWLKNKFTTKEISWWYVLAVFSLAVLIQLHFIAFLCFPIVFLSYSLFSEIKFSRMTIFLSTCVFLIMFSPVILSEIRTDGQNMQGLISSIGENKNEEHNILEKSFRAFQETSNYYLVIFSGNQDGGDVILTRTKGHRFFSLVCDKKCKNRLPYLIFSVSFFTVSILSFAFYLLKIKFSFAKFKAQTKSCKINKFKLNNLQKNLKLKFIDFTIIGFEVMTKLVSNKKITFLIIPWLLMGGLFLTLVAYQISPRFYLFMFPVFLILLGSLFYFIENTFKKWGKQIVLIFVITLVCSNLLITRKIFSEINLSRTKSIDSSRDLVMNRTDLITLSQLRDIANFISQSEKEGKKVIVGDNRYARAIYYLTSFENKSDALSCYIKRGGFDENVVVGRDYYLLVRNKTEKQINDKMMESHYVKLEKSFGTLKLFKLSPKESLDNKDEILKGCFIR